MWCGPEWSYLVLTRVHTFTLTRFTLGKYTGLLDQILFLSLRSSITWVNNLTVISLCYSFLDINRAIELIDKLKGSKLKVKLVYLFDTHFLRLVYCTDKISPGVVRPWQLGWRSDFSVSGMVDPEVAVSIIELICSEGFLSHVYLCLQPHW